MARTTAAIDPIEGEALATMRADQKMALLTQAFEMELAEAKKSDSTDAPWPIWKTLLLAGSVSAVLWAAIIAAVRFI